MSDLPTHVLLCAERYERLMEKLKKQDWLLYVIGAAAILNILGFSVGDIAKILL